MLRAHIGKGKAALSVLPLLGLKIHRDAIDAVTQMGRRRAILEDMTEMAAAAAAVHLSAGHAIAPVGRRFDRPFNRIVKARPAGAAVEFLLRYEQRLIAAGAGEGAVTLLVIERAAAGGLGAVLAHHLVLLRREQPVPFRVRVSDGVLLGVHDSSDVSLRRDGAAAMGFAGAQPILRVGVFPPCRMG